VIREVVMLGDDADRSHLETLDQFITRTLQRKFPSNAYVNEPGFRDLYVRMSRRLLEGRMLYPVLDIANVEAEIPGNGAFTSLVERLLKQGHILYVESVLNKRFAAKLLRMGFIQVTFNVAPSFYKEPNNS
jgi:hypothetical protein